MTTVAKARKIMLYLLLALLSSACITVLMRLSERYRQNPGSMLSMNYLMCSLLSLLFSGQTELFPAGEGLATALWLGGTGGVLFLGSFLLLQWNVSRNGVALPATFMKLGVLVPTLLSVLLFGEKLTFLRALGIGAAVAAILLMQGGGHREERGSLGGLVLLLLSGGMADAMSKLYEEWGHPAWKDHFLLYTFLVALVLCTVLCLVRREKLCLRDVLFGLGLGIPNYLSTRFLLLALGQLPAVVVFPTFSVGTIVLVTLAGLILFGEKLPGRKLLALGIILAALVLLNL